MFLAYEVSCLTDFFYGCLPSIDYHFTCRENKFQDQHPEPSMSGIGNRNDSIVVQHWEREKKRKNLSKHLIYGHFERCWWIDYISIYSAYSRYVHIKTISVWAIFSLSLSCHYSYAIVSVSISICICLPESLCYLDSYVNVVCVFVCACDQYLFNIFFPCL